MSRKSYELCGPGNDYEVNQGRRRTHNGGRTLFQKGNIVRSIGQWIKMGSTCETIWRPSIDGLCLGRYRMEKALRDVLEKIWRYSPRRDEADESRTIDDSGINIRERQL